MTYNALYRQWRPTTFSELVGQPHVAQTLQNALMRAKVAHAYLFCGPRGTGKTSVARILARALNCERGGVEPCNECRTCKKILAGASLDVLEVDAASNRGIDEIRDLREKTRYAPGEGRYKVYIVDEVHMLTAEAANALLKTLEDPPPHMVFILATTEPHKIPLTIVSRCQRFDFRRLAIEEILRRLEEVCRHLSVRTEPGVLRVIARHADGALRDALSLLDQCLAFAGEVLTAADVAAVLGNVDEELLGRLTQALVRRDTATCLAMVEEVWSGGKDMRQLVLDLLAYLRELLLAALNLKPGGDSSGLSPELLMGLIEGLAEVEHEIRWSFQPRLLLEVALLRLMGFPAGVAAATTEVEVPARTFVPEATASAAGRTPDEASPRVKLKEGWARALELVQRKDRLASAWLEYAVPLAIQGDDLVLGFPKEYSLHRERVERGIHRLVAGAAKVIWKRPLRISCTELPAGHRPEGGASSGGDTPVEPSPPLPPESDAVLTDTEGPLVQRAMEIFAGRIVDTGHQKQERPRPRGATESKEGDQ